MIRFCQQLGFKGLKDFQIQLAQDTPQENENTIEPIVDNHDNPHIVLQNFYQVLNIILKKQLI